MRLVLWVLRLAVTAVAIAIAVEGGYRLYLYVKHPDYFTLVDGDVFAVYRESPWQYDRDYGYSYVPAAITDVTVVKDAKVTGCYQETVVNEQGNLGPPVPDFD